MTKSNQPCSPLFIGQRRFESVRTNSTLEAEGARHVAMESTGVYWKPVWHVLESSFELVLAVQPQRLAAGCEHTQLLGVREQSGDDTGDFRPGQKEQKDDREAQIEQILRAAGMQAPARVARPGAPYIEKDW